MKLSDTLSEHFRILPAQEKALKRLRIESIQDLLYHFPARYTDASEIQSIESLKKGEAVAIAGEVSGLKTSKAWKKKIPMSEAWITDATGKLKVIWFHQPYLAKILHAGSAVRLEGKISERNGSLYISNPKIDGAPNLFASHLRTLFPVYPETKGLTSNWLSHKLQAVLNSKLLDSIEDPIPAEILKKYALPSLKSALIYIHTPKRLSDAEGARKRFAFEEIFFIQLERQRLRERSREERSFIIDKDEKEVDAFIKRFAFEATNAQKRAVKDALKDFKNGHPMARLLEGDVGSGKTAVAATLAYAVVTSRPKDQNFGRLQTAIMAPTEILAQQHFDSFIKLFRHLPINIALITGSGGRKFPSKVNPDGWTDISRGQLKKWVASGEIAIVVGTHALIQKSVQFKHLALAVIDEQHRFGTAQRQKLVMKEERVPHLLSMTATPIPRTLALTLYGDLDLTLLDEMPPGRKKILTEIVLPKAREKMYEKIREELKQGRQAYVICPRIDLPDDKNELALQAKSVTAEAKRLKEEVFPEYEVAALHGKMSPKEKERVMNDFKIGLIDILVSTSVVEVGVSVENASIILIEGAERFGLAQLHQLRGRVLRGTHQPYCFVLTDSTSKASVERLRTLETAKNGFELAEFDLAQRGAGALSGTKQWGISDLGMEAIKNLKMVEAAREEARKIVLEDLELESYPLLQERLNTSSAKIHFE